jgi:Uma2 family endonuclease
MAAVMMAGVVTPGSVVYNLIVSTPARQLFTEPEYLALERASETKHEFHDGEIVAMAGARPPHNALSANAIVALTALGRPRGCVVFTSDQRVRVPARRFYTYPDVSVAYGERRYAGDDPPSLLNPVLIVEVTSDSTEDSDRSRKFLAYQSIESLREYLVVSHLDRRVDHFQKLDSGQWLLTGYVGEGAEIRIAALEGSIRLAEIYAGVDLAEGAR